MRTLVKAAIALSFISAAADRHGASAGRLLRRAWRTRRRRWISVPSPLLQLLWWRMAHGERLPTGLDGAGRRL